MTGIWTGDPKELHIYSDLQANDHIRWVSVWIVWPLTCFLSLFWIQILPSSIVQQWLWNIWINRNQPRASFAGSHSQHCDGRAAEVSEGCANMVKRLSLDWLWMLSGRNGGQEAAPELITELNASASCCCSRNSDYKRLGGNLLKRLEKMNCTRTRRLNEVK